MEQNWAYNEFKSVDLGDNRLNKRLLKLSEDFIKTPESPINQSCKNWAATKAAYRFFQNDKVSSENITDSHAESTLKRCNDYENVLTIQDTSYFTYSHHEKTIGLCPLSRTRGKYEKGIYTLGVIMHSALAISPEGLPLGIIAQKIYSRPEETEENKELKRRTHNSALPIEEKDSYRWIELLQRTHDIFQGSGVNPITICDRESDIFDFFHLASKLKTKVVVRASHNRKINKTATFSEITGEQLWTFMKNKQPTGRIELTIPGKKDQEERIAECNIKVSNITFTPPKNHLKSKELPKLELYAIYLEEPDCPDNVTPVDWLLLTNIPVETFDEAIEKVKWYCLRWRIEVFHKVLKSGLKVEDCRLQTANRLINYLSVMSVVAWRIFWITLVSRVSPNTSCIILLNDFEWKILYSLYNDKPMPEHPPSIKECVTWISMLGGFLGRKHDKDPGIIYVWRGLKKFSNILEGAVVAEGYLWVIVRHLKGAGRKKKEIHYVWRFL